MKLPWDKQYLKISFHVIVTTIAIYCLALIFASLGEFTCSIKNTISYIMKLLSPLVFGIIIAYLLDPLVVWYQKQLSRVKIIKVVRKNKKEKSTHRSIATFLAFITILFILGLFIALLSYSIASQFRLTGDFDEMISEARKYVDGLNNVIVDIESTLQKYDISSEKLEEYIKSFSEGLINIGYNIGINIINFISNLAGHLTNIFLAIIIAIYLLIDKETFLKQWNLFLKAILSKKTDRKVHSFWKDLNRILSGYIRGQMLDAMIMIFLLSITLSIVGIKFAVIIGITAGLANLIPYFGPLVAYVLTIGMSIITGDFINGIYAIIALAVVQQIDGSIIGPKLIGGSVKLHPVFVLLSIIIGGATYGLLGMLIAVPVAAVIKLFLTRFIEHRLDGKEI
ncbi:MAG: AI-2E family transporter [bacterium]